MQRYWLPQVREMSELKIVSELKIKSHGQMILRFSFEKAVHLPSGIQSQKITE
jgi:hypothetical protein